MSGSWHPFHVTSRLWPLSAMSFSRVLTRWHFIAYPLKINCIFIHTVCPAFFFWWPTSSEMESGLQFPSVECIYRPHPFITDWSCYSALWINATVQCMARLSWKPVRMEREREKRWRCHCGSLWTWRSLVIKPLKSSAVRSQRLENYLVPFPDCS